MLDLKEELLRVLRYYESRIEQGSCSMSEMESALRTLEENMEVNGTIDDFARFYGKSKDAVNSVIKRRMIDKPKRNVVLYPFHKFNRLIPSSWRVKRKQSTE